MKNKNFLAILSLLVVSQISGQSVDLDLFRNLKIRNVGPANMSGRITAIDVVESNPKIMYVGAASGGVWKSENGGTRWTSIFDDNPTVNIGAIAIQQRNPSVIWVGTGEGNPRNSMNLGMGIFKSLDAGKSWQQLGLQKTKTIHRIIVHPDHPNTVYVGAMGDPFTPGPNRGLYRTQDGGKQWERILFTNEESGIADLVMDPENPNKMFAALYEHRRTPFSFRSGGEGSGLFMTLDGGETWKQLGVKNGLPAGQLGRIGLTIAPSNPNRVYAKIEATVNAIYRSDDGGFNWVEINNDPKFANNRPFYFQDLAVDSRDENRLYNIYQPLSVSYDGGVTFDPTPQIPADETKGIHADFHAFWMSPDDPDFYIIGGDGGIGITRDKGESWFFPESIPVGQFYQVNVDEDVPYNVYGGLQDNGNWYGPGYVWRRGGIRTLYWQYLVGGDGFYISPDPEDSRFGYGTSQNGNLYRYDKIGGYYASIKPPQPDDLPRLRFNWNAAFARHPHDDNTVYYGSQYVHKTTDEGSTWEIISPDLTNNNPDQQKRDYGGLTLDASGAEFYNSILTIAPSPINPNVLWVGTDDGNVQVSQDGGTTWKNVNEGIKEMPENSWVARIHASDYSAGTAWATVNNYRQGDYKPYLFKTENFGKSWKSMADKKGIEGYSLSFIQDPVEPNLVFLGTENGLWVSFDKGENWQKVKNGFPSVSTMDLKIQRSESALVIGTFGRSIWILDDLKSLRVAAANELDQPLTVLPVNNQVQVKGLFINAPGNIWTGFHTTFEGQNRPFQRVDIPFFLTNTDSDSKPIMHIVNEKNETIQKVISEDFPVKGLNYLRWNLDEKIDRLPGSWITEESRGIPVLPGNYKAVINYGLYNDSTSITVLPDPRFDIDQAIDQALYDAQSRLQAIRVELIQSLNELVRKSEKLDEFKVLLEKNLEKYDSLTTKTQEIIERIQYLRDDALGKKPEKQVGAWQSFQITSASKIREAEKKFISGHSLPSSQELQLLDDAEKLVTKFQQSVLDFEKEHWNPFKKQASQINFEWF